MRVVGGKCKGRRLSPFRGLEIRPTPDKVREAVFNILAGGGGGAGGGRFEKVLDLFAGTGAMGIEALSRGSTEAVFVDMNPGAVSVIKKNLEACGLTESAKVYKREVKGALKTLSARHCRFDLIIIDPPYESSLTEETLKDIEASGLLSPGGIIVAETSKRNPIETGPAGLELLDVRRYGDTSVYFFTAAG